MTVWLLVGPKATGTAEGFREWVDRTLAFGQGAAKPRKPGRR